MDKILLNKKVLDVKPMNRVWLFIELADELSINIECFFRVINSKGHIEFTSDDYESSDFDEDMLASLKDRINQSIIEKIIINKCLGDLELMFSSGDRLQLFAHSGLLDSWSISGKQGTLFEVSGNRGIQEYC